MLRMEVARKMNRNTKRALRNRQTLDEYKLQIGCADCGYNKHAAALEFDHLPGTFKSQTVASLMYRSWERIWQEIAKCELVCANCHAIRTAERRLRLAS